MRLVWVVIPLVLALIFTVSSIPVSFGAFPGSPNFQLESGVAPEDIVCRDNRVLALRTNGEPVCMKEKHIDKLGWTVVDVTFTKSEIDNLNNQFDLQRAPAQDLSLWGNPIVTSSSDPNGIRSLSSHIQSISSQIQLDSISTVIDPNYQLIQIRELPPSPLNSVFSTMVYLPQNIDFGLLTTSSDVYLNDGIVVHITGYDDTGIDWIINNRLENEEHASYEEINNLRILLIDYPNGHIINSANFWDEETPLQVQVTSLNHTSQELKDIGLAVFGIN